MKENQHNKWWHHATIYEIYPRSFCDANGDGDGDLQGIIRKASYLKTLGVDAIWLCPIFASSFMDSGYDMDDYYAINPMFGTQEDLDQLISVYHQLDMRVILDITLNHTSDRHPWFLDACASKDSAYREDYIFREGRGDGPPNNWVSSRTMRSMWTYNAATDDYYFHIYTQHQPDLNWRNPSLRQRLYDMLRYWIDRGVDGFRLDVINKIAKPDEFNDVPDGVYADALCENRTESHAFIQEMRQAVLPNDRDILLLGQTGGVTIPQAEAYTAGLDQELDLFLQFEHLDIDRGRDFNRRSWTVPQLKQAVLRWQRSEQNNTWPTVFFGSHDSGRMLSRYGDDRLRYRRRSAQMLAALQLCLGGTHIIYMGDELGVANRRHRRLDEFRDVRSRDVIQARLEQGDEASKILDDLNELARDHARYPIHWSGRGQFKGYQQSIYHFYQKLLELRRQEEALQWGQTRSILDDHSDVFAYTRTYHQQRIVLIANMSSRRIELNFQREDSTLILSNYQRKVKGILRPYEVRIYRENICSARENSF